MAGFLVSVYCMGLSVFVLPMKTSTWRDVMKERLIPPSDAALRSFLLSMSRWGLATLNLLLALPQFAPCGFGKTDVWRSSACLY